MSELKLDGQGPSWKDWLSLTIAIVALVQPWAIALWRRIFPSQLGIYETGTIEIGFSGLGCTLALHGTLRSYRDCFVSSGRVYVRKLKDNAVRQFDWAVFRGITGKLSQPNEVEFELASGFMVLSSAPRKYNILFQDVVSAKDARDTLSDLQAAWNRVKQDFVSGATDPKEIAEKLAIATATQYQNFSQSTGHLAAFKALDRAFWWQPGKYELMLEFVTDKPKGSRQRKWIFELSKTDVEFLNANVVRILAESCNQPFGQYFFAYPVYQLALK